MFHLCNLQAAMHVILTSYHVIYRYGYCLHMTCTEQRATQRKLCDMQHAIPDTHCVMQSVADHFTYLYAQYNPHHLSRLHVI